MEMVTKSNTEGFYHWPRIDRELLDLHRDGIACLSGCPSAHVPRLLASGKYEEALRAAGQYREIFGDGYFLELQNHEHVPELERINLGLVKILRETGIPVAGTNDSHYVRRKDSPSRTSTCASRREPT